MSLKTISKTDCYDPSKINPEIIRRNGIIVKFLLTPVNCGYDLRIFMERQSQHHNEFHSQPANDTKISTSLLSRNFRQFLMSKRPSWKVLT